METSELYYTHLLFVNLNGLVSTNQYFSFAYFTITYG